MNDRSDLSYRLLAARFIRRQVRQLREQLDGVRCAEDIEFVHRARVASRRLRAAMQMFANCWSRKRVEGWRKHTRRITRKLGDARDKDVQIEFLCGILGAITQKSEAPGVARLLAQAEHERELLQPRVVRAVAKLHASRVLEQMQTATKKVLTAAEAGSVQYSSIACDQTKQSILQRLEELLLQQSSLDDPEDCPRHHAMRIAAKRLRYTMEIAKPVYEGRLDEIIEATRKVQSLLGDVHDCDVWLEQLNRFAEAERVRLQAYFGNTARFARVKPGLDYLQRERSQLRRRVFEELVSYWQQLQQQGLWPRLVQVVEARASLQTSMASSNSVSPATAASMAAEAAVPAAIAPVADADRPAKEAKTNGSPPACDALPAGL